MRHIPNVLSAFRIVLIPIFIYVVLGDNFVAAAVVLALSGVTDFLDGFLARKFGWVSQLGKVLDPAADKLTQITVCLLFIVKLRKFRIFFVILLAKEIAMLCAGGYLIKLGIKVTGARWFGKVVTTLFYITCVSIILFPSMPEGFQLVVIAITTLCAIGAVILYLPELGRLLKSKVPPPPQTEK